MKDCRKTSQNYSISSRKHTDIKKEIEKKEAELMKHQAICDALQDSINLLKDLL